MKAGINPLESKEAIEEFGLEPMDRFFQAGSHLRGDGPALDCRI